MGQIRYTNFRVCLCDWKDDQTFTVQVIDDEMRPPVRVSFDESVIPVLGNLIHPTAGAELGEDILKELGAKLADMLRPIRDKLAERLKLVGGDDNRQPEGMRLILDIQEDRLALLPWEYLYLNEEDVRFFRSRADRAETAEVLGGQLGGFFVGRHPLISIVRWHQPADTARPSYARVEDALNVFIGAADPKDESLNLLDLDVEREVAEIQEALGKAKSPVRVTAEPKLTESLLRQNLEPTNHIFHFAGHGGLLPRSAVKDGIFTKPLKKKGAVAADNGKAVEARIPDDPDFRKPDDPDFRKPDDPDFRQLDDPDFRQLDDPDFRQLDDPDFRQLDDPDFRQLDDPDFRKLDDPDFRKLFFAKLFVSGAPEEEDLQGAVMLEGEKGKHQVLWAEALAEALQGKARIAVLSACQTGAQRSQAGSEAANRRRNANSAQWSGLPSALLKSGVQAVVGMQYVISDEAAILFAENLYEALANGLMLDEAVAYARAKVADRDDPDRVNPGQDEQEWGVPVLYINTEDDVLFEELANASALQAARKECHQYLLSPQIVETMYGGAG